MRVAVLLQGDGEFHDGWLVAVLGQPLPVVMPESGKKYLRTISLVDGQVDVYSVLVAFGGACPATQHAIKKLLAAGLHGKATALQDLTEARDAIDRAIQIRRQGG